jgi:hypothetical protein
MKNYRLRYLHRLLTHLSSVADLKSSKISVSRIGSGSYVMGFVLGVTILYESVESNLTFT